MTPKNVGLSGPNWEHEHLESALSQVPKMFEQPENFRRALSSLTQYHVLDVSQRAPVKMPQQLRPATLPGENGEDLAPFLYNLRESSSEKYEAIEDSLKAAFPGFESLNFPIVAAGMISMNLERKSVQESTLYEPAFGRDATIFVACFPVAESGLVHRYYDR